MTQDPRPAPAAAAPTGAAPATDAAPATGAPVGAATTRTAPSSHMRSVRRLLLGLAVFQGLSTLVGFVELLLAPHYFAFLLDGTAFAGRYALAAVLLGVVVGGIGAYVATVAGFLLSGALLRATGIVLGVVYVKNGRNLYCSAVLHILINLGSLLPNLVS